MSMNRLRWQCRRGMLELDILLNRFLDLQWVNLDDDLKREFTVLLGRSDRQLQAWLTDGHRPDKDVRQIVKRICNTNLHPAA